MTTSRPAPLRTSSTSRRRRAPSRSTRPATLPPGMRTWARTFFRRACRYRKRGGSLGHYQGMEKDERFSHFRGRVMGSLIMTLGAMAAEHVFYGENSQGVSGDVQSATATAAADGRMWAMGPDAVHLDGSLDVEDDAAEVLKRLERIGMSIMNRASGGMPMMPGTRSTRFSGIRRSGGPPPRSSAQAYVSAYALMATNRESVEQIADILIERKEMHGRRGRRHAQQRRVEAAGHQSDDDSTWPRV